MKVVNHSLAGLLVFALAAGVAACADTLHGAAKDTSNVGEKISEGARARCSEASWGGAWVSTVQANRWAG